MKAESFLRISARLLKTFPTFYGTRRFIALFSRACLPLDPILSQMNLVYTPSRPHFSSLFVLGGGRKFRGVGWGEIESTWNIEHYCAHCDSST
jgi:hypothetical protein